MKRRELPKDPTSSRRKAIILEVGTLGHILLTSSLGYRLIEKSLVSAWPRIKKKGRGQAGKDRVNRLLRTRRRDLIGGKAGSHGPDHNLDLFLSCLQPVRREQRDVSIRIFPLVVWL